MCSEYIERLGCEYFWLLVLGVEKIVVFGSGVYVLEY